MYDETAIAFMVIALFILGIIFSYAGKKSNESVQREEQNVKMNVRKAFESITIGMETETALNALKYSFGVYNPNLEFEGYVENGIYRQIYFCQLVWEYQAGRYSGDVSVYVNNRMGSGSNNLGSGMGYSSGKELRRGFIRLVCDNGRVASKQQEGLYAL